MSQSKKMLMASASSGEEKGWFRTFGTLGTDNISRIISDSSGNIYSVGYTSTPSDVVVSKHDKDGVFQWTRSFSLRSSTSFSNYVRDVDFDSSGNIALFGYSVATFDSNLTDIFCVKYNPAGDKVFHVSFTSPPNAQAITILSGKIDPADNSIYFAGYRRNGGSFSATDAFLAKVNSNGTSITWARKLTWPNSLYIYDTFNDIALDSSANVICVGETRKQYGLGIVAKYNSSGVLQWKRKVDNTTVQTRIVFNAVAIDSSDNIYVTGSDTLAFGLLVFKYNSSGVLQWKRRLFDGTFQNLKYPTGKDITFAPDGTLIISGYLIWNSPTQNYSYGGYILSMGTDGTIIYDRAFGGSQYSNFGRTFFNGVTTQGNNMVHGGTTTIPSDTQGSSSFENDFLVVKLPVDGSLTGTYRTNYVYEPVGIPVVADTLADTDFTELLDTASNLDFTSLNPPVNLELYNRLTVT
jgi:hypothetical protein